MAIEYVSDKTKTLYTLTGKSKRTKDYKSSLSKIKKIFSLQYLPSKNL